jgi:hypothetical protein
MTPAMDPTVALPALLRVALNALKMGNSPDSVLDTLVRKGLPEPYARKLMDAALTQVS